MNVKARAGDRGPTRAHVLDFSKPGLSSATPAVPSQLDEDSYQPLASLAHEVGRELGSDGMLVTWHEDAGEPQHLFAEGACEARFAVAGDVANMGRSAARLGATGARSHWQVLRADRSAGALTTSFPVVGGVLTITALFQRIGQSTRIRASEAAARLAPLLHAFFHTWSSRLKAVATVRALTSVINDSDFGVLLLDDASRLLFVNSVAEQFLIDDDGLRRKGLTVAGANTADTLRLYAAIDQALAPIASRRGAKQSIVALRRRSGRPLMLAVVPAEDVGAARGECAVIIYVVDPDQDLHTLIEPVCELYGLSPAETRLACILARGKSLGEAAEQMHVREQTARGYLKHIFLKTDTNRQVELVRLFLLSAVPSGAHPRVVTP